MIRRWHEKRAHDERGFVMVWTAISLVVLMAMAGFAVDIGAWYSRAGRIQRAADAAALAGVVYMPSNLPRARAVALETAARNGFTDPNPNAAGDEVDITVEPVTGAQNRLRVTITDHEVEAFFAAVFMDSIEIGRRAIGQFAEPIPLGSPENQFGIGPAQPPTPAAYGLPDTGFYPPRQNFYAAVNGRCAAAEEGDLLLSRYDGNAPTSTGVPYTCAAELNREYSPQGYTYVIEYNPASAALPYAWQVQVWDPAFTPSTTDPSTNGSQDYPLDYTWSLSGSQWTRDVSTTDVDTTYEFVAPDTAGTPLDPTDDRC